MSETRHCCGGWWYEDKQVIYQIESQVKRGYGSASSLFLQIRRHQLMKLMCKLRGRRGSQVWEKAGLIVWALGGAFQRYTGFAPMSQHSIAADDEEICYLK